MANVTQLVHTTLSDLIGYTMEDKLEAYKDMYTEKSSYEKAAKRFQISHYRVCFVLVDYILECIVELKLLTLYIEKVY